MLCPVQAKCAGERPLPDPMDKVASIMQTALGGIRRSLDGLRGTARDIATVSVSGAEPLRSEILWYAPWNKSGRSRPLCALTPDAPRSPMRAV